MEDSGNKGNSPQKPLDTRLHHYVPVEDVDRKILNGSDATHVTIPEDAVISFTTGRVKVKKSASNNSSERESIPLETMLPSYETEDKISAGLGEKAELEAELANHKNGLWSEGHHAYSDGPFTNNEKLNGTSKSSDEIGLPVNNHRKCLSSDESDTSSEQKSTGEKLYFTEDNRKLCPGWRRVFLCGLLLIILAVALLLGVLAATGILLAESENKNTRYESGHSLPSIDSISHAGHSFRSQPSKVPQNSVPPEDASHLPSNETSRVVVDTVSLSPPPTVTSKVPPLNDTSHSQTIVPNALVGEFTIIDENFTEDLKDNTSHGYTSLAIPLELELHRIFKRSGGAFQNLKILSFSPGSIKVKFVTIWTSEHNIILSEKAVEIMKSYLRKKYNFLLAFPVDLNSIHFTDVFDECRVQKGGCSYNCSWDYNTLAKTCVCEENMVLLADGKSCGLESSTSTTAELSSNVTYKTSSTISTSVTEPSVFRITSPETTVKLLKDDNLTTTPITTTLTNATTMTVDIFNNSSTTQSSVKVKESTTARNLVLDTESSPNFVTTVSSTSEQPTTVSANTLTTENPTIPELTTTQMSKIVTIKVVENENNHTSVENTTTIENINNSTNLYEVNVTNFNQDFKTNTEVSSLSRDQISKNHNHSEINTNSSIYTENQEVTTAMQLNTTEPSTIIKETKTTEPRSFTYYSEINTINPRNSEGKNENTTTNLSTTAPSIVINETTIGYHIENKTNQIYTLNSSNDFITETIPLTNIETGNVTNSSIVTTNIPMVTSKNASSKITETDNMTQPIFTTYIPNSNTVTEKYEKSVPVEITKYDTTMAIDMAAYATTPSTMTEYHTTQQATYDTVTEVIHFTNNTMNAYDLIHETLINNSTEENFTELTTPPKKLETESLVTEAPFIVDKISTTTNSVLSENNIYETTITSVDSVTTVKPSIIPSFNRTPGIRSFDNFTNVDENSTFVLNIDILSTAATLIESTTEVNTFTNTFFITAPKANEIPTSTPFTTPISLVESLTETTKSSTIANGIAETALNNKTELSSTNSSILNKDEIPVTMYPNSSTILSNNSETLVNMEHKHETDKDHTTVSFHNSKPSTIMTTEKPPDVTIQPVETLTETYFLGNVSENITFEITTISSYNNSNTDSLNTSKNSQVTFPNTEISMQPNNETTNMEHFNTTISSMEVNSTITTVKNTNLILNSELPNSTSTFNTTVNPFISSTTVKLLTNESAIANSTVVVPLTKYVNVTEVTSEKVIDNTNITESLNFTDFNGTKETFTLTTPQDFTFPTPMYFNDSEANFTTESVSVNVLTTMEYNSSILPEEILDLNLTHTIGTSIKSPLDGMHSTLLPGQNESLENSTLTDDVGNFTTDGYEIVTNETTTNASTGIECREDQFLCESLNKCINNTFMCDGIVDCPDGQDEYKCKDTCHSNFMCTNSSVCIMNDARCDGIWDCENGTDEENCTPTECAKHEVMCSDGSKCIRPGDICDWKYNCRDRSDEVGCVERTTCESGGRFFCNDGLCIPWSLKCDGEFDCKEGEDEGNCTCLNDEFRCNDGKCLKSSSRCDGHKDCHDAGDEMGCVNVDTEHIVSTYEPYSGTWGLLCAEDWNLDDGQYLCQEFGFGHVLNVEKVHVSFNGTWMAMRRGNLTDSSLWTERVSFVESCTSSLAARVECQKFACGEYTGLLHRRRRDTISSSSSQWPFIGYASTFHSSRGCLSEILTPIWLITSAECLLSISKEPFNGSDWYVRTNIGRNVEPDQAQNHEVLKIISHPHSSKFRSLTLRDYDVALIRLKHALVFVSDKIGAICPPEEQVPPGITCFSGVLGTEKPRAPPPKSLAINSLALQIIDKGNCNGIEHFNNTINQRMLCTQSSEGHTICDNDEGTPLMCLTGINKWFLAGMLTYQRFCDVYLKHPAVFSNLFSMRKFLDQITGQKQYEIPYDNNVYIIIPPTTPSPTVPETTTLAMTTTEMSLPVTTYLTTLNFENATETVLGNSGDINGTTVTNEDLSKGNTSTTLVLREFTTELPNITDIYGNGSTHLHYGMKFDAFNATLEEIEKSDKFTMNKTHHYLMTLSNDTSSDSESNTTDISAFNNSTSLKNETMSNFFKITSNDFDLKNITITSETIRDTNTTNDSLILDDVNLTTELITPENSTTDFMKFENSTTDLIKLENSTVGFLNPKNTTDFTNLENSTTDFMQLKNSTVDFMKLKNTTDFTNLKNSTTDFIKLENSTFDVMEFKNVTGFTKVENSTVGFMKLENITGFMQHENSTRFMRLENKTLDVIKIYKDIANKSLKFDKDNKTKESIKLDTTNRTVVGVDVSNLTMNESIPVSQPLVLTLNDSIDAFTFIPDFNGTTEIIQPISIFNISSEMNQPIMKMINKTISVNEPVIYEKNNSTKTETLTTSSSKFYKNNTETNTEPSNIPNKTVRVNKIASLDAFDATLEETEKSIDKFMINKTHHNLMTLPNDTYFDAESNKADIFTLNETSTTLNTSPFKSELKLITTETPIKDFTKSFEIIMGSKPHEDLAFSIFNDSKGIKFEHLIMPEMNMNNTFEKNLSITEPYRSEINSTNPLLSSETSPSVDETTIVPFEHTTNSLSLLADNVFQNSATKPFNSTEFPALIVDNMYNSPTTEFSNLTEIPLLNIDEKFKEAEYSNPIQYSTLMTDNTLENMTNKFSELDFTTPIMFEVEAESKISDISFSPANDSTTLISEISPDANITVPEDFTKKTHIMSEKLAVIQNSSFLSNISDCGLWHTSSGNNNFAGKSFFMQWPALGFLQIVSDTKICASVVLSSKFVITSLNCLLFSNNQLNPERWTYINGVYNPNISSGGTQNHVVAKIIPYPDQSMPLLFYEHDVALVKLKDNIKMDNYSTTACLPHEDVAQQQLCFTTGWTRNVTGNNNEKQFYSVPVSIVSSDVCNNTANFNGLLLDTLICGTLNNTSIQACQMNLGSPLFCLNENKQWEIQGTLSFLDLCGIDRPSVFNNVARLRKWIFDVLRNEETLD